MTVHTAIPTQPNGGNHTPEFTESSRTPEAHAAAMRVAKGLALVGTRVLDDAAFFQEVCTFSIEGCNSILGWMLIFSISQVRKSFKKSKKDEPPERWGSAGSSRS